MGLAYHQNVAHSDSGYVGIFTYNKMPVDSSLTGNTLQGKLSKSRVPGIIASK
jgi:hypothetical protein